MTSNVPTQAPQKYLDEHIIYCDCAVATQEQISESMKQAILEAEKILGYKTHCRYKINLLVSREGEYFGYGYIWVSSSEIYWMLLGRNPDGSERVEEYPDPDWVAPKVVAKQDSKSEEVHWIDQVEEEDAFVQPMIKKILDPLVEIPGYRYDQDQRKHLEELMREEAGVKEGGEKEAGAKEEVPEMGYFELSRAYAMDAPAGTCRNRICARHVPPWIPIDVFKSLFSFYCKKGSKYPEVSFIETKKAGRMVFINFDPSSKDAIFTLLMTKKQTIVNPKNDKQKTTLIFTHAFDNKK